MRKNYANVTFCLFDGNDKPSLKSIEPIYENISSLIGLDMNDYMNDFSIGVGNRAYYAFCDSMGLYKNEFVTAKSEDTSSYILGTFALVRLDSFGNYFSITKTDYNNILNYISLSNSSFINFNGRELRKAKFVLTIQAKGVNGNNV